MPARDPRVREIASRIGGTAKADPHADLTELRQKLRDAKAEATVRQLVAGVSPAGLESVLTIVRSAVAS